MASDGHIVHRMIRMTTAVYTDPSATTLRHVRQSGNVVRASFPIQRKEKYFFKARKCAYTNTRSSSTRRV